MNNTTDDTAETHVNTAPGKRWTHVRVPVALAARLESLARATEANHAAGRIALPVEHCQRVPIWLIIDRAIAEQESRRERSRRPRRRRASP